MFNINILYVKYDDFNENYSGNWLTNFFNIRKTVNVDKNFEQMLLSKH